MQQRLRALANLTEFGHFLVNDSQKILAYRTAVFWQARAAGRGQMQAVSGIPEPVADAPFTIWMTRLCHHLSRSMKTVSRVSVSDIDEAIALDWAEYLPAHVVWLPLTNAEGDIIGGLIFARDIAWRDEELALLSHWAEAAAHAFDALLHRRTSLFDRLRHFRTQITLAFVALFILMMFWPVSLTVLAPAEVIASRPDIIRAPLDGVIGSIEVQPNSAVKAGDVLLRLDDASLLARMDVAKQELAVARAEYRRAEQAAVTDRQASTTIPMLSARIDQARAEVAYIDSLIKKIELRAERDGIAIIADAAELLGRPVKIGEKLMTLADPAQIEIEAWLEVSNSIPLPEDAQIELFLNVDPGNPYAASLDYVNYQAEVSPEGILAFRSRARFDDSADLRIGWHGTAKFYGAEVPLYYYLFRRPFAVFRQWVGI